MGGSAVWWWPVTCPTCGAPADRVLYLGLPMNLCDAEECRTLWGFWSLAPVLVPITPDGGWVFVPYEGSYLAALWRWLRGAAVVLALLALLPSLSIADMGRRSTAEMIRAGECASYVSCYRADTARLRTAQEYSGFYSKEIFHSATPTPGPITTSSAEAVRRILDRLERVERLERDLRGWPHDLGIILAGAAADALTTGMGRDRGLVESNPAIGNGPGAAERHVAIKTLVVVAAGAGAYELRRAGHPKAARIGAYVLGGMFAAVAVHNATR